MDADKTKVILVGNSKFPEWGEEKDIPNVDQNMESLKKIFLDQNYFGIPNDNRHFVEIKNEEAKEILLKVKHETKAFEDRNKFERLIFYYSGHGIPGEDRKLFFAANDTIRKDYEITSVDSALLFSYLKGFGAKELIVILDCCYAAQTKENQGDADSLIQNSLPEERHDAENGAYYLFAAGKDNVAKFNPKQPNDPTYFTTALLNSIHSGTMPGKDFVTIGELYAILCKEINDLKKNKNPDIPDPRPVSEGEAGGFVFCKNINFKNQEDLEWLELLKDPNLKKITIFEDRYPQTRYDSEKDELRRRIYKGLGEIETMKKSKDYDLASKIKKEYLDIPMIRDTANQFMKDLVVEKLDLENEIEKAASSNRARLSGAGVTQASEDLAKAADKATGINKESLVVTDSSAIRKDNNDKMVRPSQSAAG